MESHNPPNNTQSTKQQKSQQLLTLQQTSPECRICLQGFLNPALEQISPCGCIGSLKYVHEDCMKLWIGKIVNVNYQDEEPKKVNKMACELCKEWIQFQTERVVRCRNVNQIKREYQKSRKNFFLLLLLLLINLGIFGALLNYLLLHGFQSLKDKNAILIILIISGIVIIGLVIIFSAYFFIKNYFFICELQVCRVFKGKERERKIYLKRDKVYSEKNSQ